MNQYNENDQKDGFWIVEWENYPVKGNGHFDNGVSIGYWAWFEKSVLILKEFYL
jgi:hypothetical protein